MLLGIGATALAMIASGLRVTRDVRSLAGGHPQIRFRIGLIGRGGQVLAFLARAFAELGCASGVSLPTDSIGAT